MPITLKPGSGGGGGSSGFWSTAGFVWPGSFRTNQTVQTVTSTDNMEVGGFLVAVGGSSRFRRFYQEARRIVSIDESANTVTLDRSIPRVSGGTVYQAVYSPLAGLYVNNTAEYEIFLPSELRGISLEFKIWSYVFYASNTGRLGFEQYWTESSYYHSSDETGASYLSIEDGSGNLRWSDNFAADEDGFHNIGVLDHDSRARPFYYSYDPGLGGLAFEELTEGSRRANGAFRVPLLWNMIVRSA